MPAGPRPAARAGMPSVSLPTSASATLVSTCIRRRSRAIWNSTGACNEAATVPVAVTLGRRYRWLCRPEELMAVVEASGVAAKIGGVLG